MSKELGPLVKVGSEVSYRPMVPFTKTPVDMRLRTFKVVENGQGIGAEPKEFTYVAQALTRSPCRQGQMVHDPVQHKSYDLVHVTDPVPGKRRAKIQILAAPVIATAQPS